jgi:hypothetical protein
LQSYSSVLNLPSLFLLLLLLHLTKAQRFDYDEPDYAVQEDSAATPKQSRAQLAVASQQQQKTKQRPETTTPVPILKQINE